MVKAPGAMFLTMRQMVVACWLGERPDAVQGDLLVLNPYSFSLAQNKLSKFLYIY